MKTVISLIMFFSLGHALAAVSNYVTYSLKIDEVSGEKIIFKNLKGKKFYVPKGVLRKQLPEISLKKDNKVTFQLTWAQRRKLISQTMSKKGIEGDSGW